MVDRNRVGLFAACAGLSLWPTGLAAQEAARLPVSPGFEQIAKMVLALVVVLAVVLVLARLSKSLRNFGGTSDSIEVVGQLALGARERLLVVQVEDKRLLLGVSAAGISRLHEFGAHSSANGEADVKFAEQLRAQVAERRQ
jgi:flagellar protein FliO/FliZ